MKEDIQPEERHCLCCEKVLSSKKRKDSKYCNEYCKTAFHNPKRAGSDAEVVRINKILLKNLQVLRELLGDKEYKYVPREKFLKKGFNFNFITQEKDAYYYCYYLCYTSLNVPGEDNLKIAKAFPSVIRKE
jgi:hypothetical protein